MKPARCDVCCYLSRRCSPCSRRAAAASASGLDVIRDCTDDEVMSKTYTQKEYRDALRQFAADGDQYGNCRDVITPRPGRRARGRQEAARPTPAAARTGTTGGATTGGGAGAIGSAPAAEQLQKATDDERNAVDAARSTESAVTLDNGTVIPANAATAPSTSGVTRPADRARRPPRAAARGSPRARRAFASDALSTRVAPDDRARAGALSVPTPAVHTLLTVGLAAIVCAVAFAADGGLNLGRTTPAEMALILGGGVAVVGRAAARAAPRAPVGHRAAGDPARARRC